MRKNGFIYLFLILQLYDHTPSVGKVRAETQDRNLVVENEAEGMEKNCKMACSYQEHCLGYSHINYKQPHQNDPKSCLQANMMELSSQLSFLPLCVKLT